MAFTCHLLPRPAPPGMLVLSREGCICPDQLYKEAMPMEKRLCWFPPPSKGLCQVGLALPWEASNTACVLCYPSVMRIFSERSPRGPASALSPSAGTLGGGQGRRSHAECTVAPEEEEWPPGRADLSFDSFPEPPANCEDFKTELSVCLPAVYAAADAGRRLRATESSLLPPA